MKKLFNLLNDKKMSKKIPNREKNFNSLSGNKLKEYYSSDKKSVLPLAVAKWMGQDTIHDWGIMIAASVLIIIPTLIFYLIIQKQFLP